MSRDAKQKATLAPRHLRLHHDCRPCPTSATRATQVRTPINSSPPPHSFVLASSTGNHALPLPSLPCPTAPLPNSSLSNPSPLQTVSPAPALPLPCPPLSTDLRNSPANALAAPLLAPRPSTPYRLGARDDVVAPRRATWLGPPPPLPRSRLPAHRQRVARLVARRALPRPLRCSHNLRRRRRRRPRRVGGRPQSAQWRRCG